MRKVPFRIGTFLAVTLVTACAPSLNWREVRTEGAEWVASLPCRPTSHTRALALAGRNVKLTLYACEAAGSTWGFAHADLQDPVAVPQALVELRRAAESNLGGAQVTALSWQPPGATPQPEAGRYRMAGRTPKGQPLASELVVFARGTAVYQATVLGQPSAEALEQFFGGLRPGR